MRHVRLANLRTTVGCLTRFAAPLTYRPRFASSLAAAHKIMNAATSPRAKRKAPQLVDDRPPKHHRVMNGGKESAGDNTPENMGDDDEYMLDDDVEVNDEALRVSRMLPPITDSAEWQATIQDVVRNVVSIRFCQTCSFDTEPALTSEATGFVVDSERG